MTEYLKKINRSSLVEVVIDRITGAIIEGTLKTGDKIPTEMELSEQLGIARNTIREAVKILVYMGVLEIRRPGGTYVATGFSDHLMDPMLYGIILNQDNHEELNELRASAESGALNLAIMKSTEEEVEVLHQKLMALKEAIFAEEPDFEKVFEKDNNFHATIIAMGKNSMTRKIDEMVLMLTYTTRYRSVKHMITTNRGAELYEAHEKVYKLLKNRQTEGLFSIIQDTYFEE